MFNTGADTPTTSPNRPPDDSFPRPASETRMIVALLGSIRMFPEGTPDQPEEVEGDDAPGLISYGSLTPLRQACHCRRRPRDGVASRASINDIVSVH